MFSQLGPLFKTHLRQAEKADARLEIRRDERNEHGKKHEEAEEEETGSGLWEDSTEVSVDALKAFLAGFLKSRGDEVPEMPDSGQDAIGLSRINAAPTPINTRTARAVKAYSNTAAHSPPQATDQNIENTEINNGPDLIDLLAADELRTMHVLITELDILTRRGVQTLTIEKADSFLQALVMAVRAEKLKG